MKAFYLFFFLLCCSISFAQFPAYKQWDKRYGGTGDEYLLTFQQTRDNGYIMGGFTNSINSADVSQTANGAEDFWVVKVDWQGRKQWDKRYGGSGTDKLLAILETTDGGYLFGGYTQSPASGNISQSAKGQMDYWVVKADPSGNIQWEKRYGGTFGEVQFSSMASTSDGGYILAGRGLDLSGDISEIYNQGLPDCWLIKIDSIGNKVWDRMIGGQSNEEYLFSFQPAADGKYIFGAWSNSNFGRDVSQSCIAGGNCSYDYWVVKVDSSGTKVWDKRFGSADDDYIESILATADGGCLAGGHILADSGYDIHSHELGSDDLWFQKVAVNGAKQWEKRIGSSGMDNLRAINKTQDGGYLISAQSMGPASADKTEANLGEMQSWIIKLDASGNKLWDKTIFTNCVLTPFWQTDGGIAVEDPDGCIVIGSYTNADTGGFISQPSRGGKDFWISKHCNTPNTQACAANFTLFATTTQGVYAGYNESEGTNLTYVWSFGDGNTSTDAYPFHQYAQPGTYTICLTVNNNAGCSDSYCNSSFYVFKTEGGQMSQLQILNPLSVETLENATSFSVFPNPADQTLNITSLFFQPETAIIYDNRGRLIIEDKFLQTIDISRLTAGQYVLELKNKKTVARKNFIKL